MVGRHGLDATGLDRTLAEADTARMTLHDHVKSEGCVRPIAKARRDADVAHLRAPLDPATPGADGVADVTVVVSRDLGPADRARRIAPGLVDPQPSRAP